MKKTFVKFLCYMLDGQGNQSKHSIKVAFRQSHYVTEQDAVRFAEDSLGLRFDWMAYA